MGAPDSTTRPAAHPSDSIAGQPVTKGNGSAITDADPPALPTDKTVISKRPHPVDIPPPAPTSDQIGHALVGKRLEHYELDEFVGGGGMGAVFRATDTRLGRTVAVKVLLHSRGDEETVRRFRNEAQSAARLDHPNIARVYYVGEDQGWNFIVFEFIDGTNLRDLVENSGPLKLEDALFYTLQVAEAIAHSSSRDVIHRDIKPSNVLVAADHQVKLVDMGLARLHQVESTSDDLTASGVTLGTFDYISPEQARDPRLADARSDVYSLGCTLYFMLTAQPPFPDGTALQKLIRHSSDEPPDVRVFRPDVPPLISLLLAKMLAKRPNQRHQNAAELISDLAGVAQQLGLAHIAQRGFQALPLGAAPSRRWEKTWQVIAALAVLIAAIVLLDSYFPARRWEANARMTPKFPKNTKAASGPIANDRRGSRPNELQAGHGTPEERSRRTGSTRTNNVEAAMAPPGPLDLAAAGAKIGPLTHEPSVRLGPPALEEGVGPPSLENDFSLADASQALSITSTDAKPKRLVVTEAPPAAADSDTEYVSSLQEACRRAGALGLAEIELRWNGRLVNVPFEVTGSRLALKAAAGSKPILVFQPSSTHRQMIRLLGGVSSRLSIQGVEIRLELPAEPVDGWSLFAMNSGQTLELSDCVLTVVDGLADSSLIHEKVAMIAVLPRRSGDTMTMFDPQPAMAQSATILLESCVARGAATVVAMNEETPLTFHWNQGLIATSRRLMETGGSATDPKFFEKIAIHLQSVTASCRQGLFQMHRAAGKEYQFAVDVTAEHCILATEIGAPLFEFVAATPIVESDVRLQSNGDSNCYPNADVVFLRISSDAPGEKRQDFELDDRRWSTETRPQVGSPWLHPLPKDVPLHALHKSDFLVDPAQATGVGFDPLRLPEASPGP